MQTIVQQIYAHLGIQYIYVGDELAKQMQHHRPTIQVSLAKEKKEQAITPQPHKKSIPPIQKNISEKNNERIAQHRTVEYTKVDIEKFELRFKKLCSSMKRTPCIWTYFSLGEDMFGNPDSDRRNTIKRMLTSLQMPQGTYSFLPFTAPNDEGILEVYKREFLGILQIYKPSLVLFFGDEALEHLGIKEQEWQEFVVFPPVRGIRLPSLVNLHEKEEEKIIRYLKEYTKKVGLV